MGIVYPHIFIRLFYILFHLIHMYVGIDDPHEFINLFILMHEYVGIVDPHVFIRV